MDPLADQYIRIRVVLPLPTRASYPDAQPAVASSSLAAVADSPNTPLEALGEVPPPAAAAASLAAGSSTSAITRANACVAAATRRSLSSFLVAAPSATSLNHAEPKQHEQRNRGEDLRQQWQGGPQERGAEKQQEQLKQQRGEQEQQHRRRRGTRVQKLVKTEKEEQQQQLTEECRPQQDADPRQQQRDGKHQQNEVRQQKKSEEHAERPLNSSAKEEEQQAACVNYGDEQRGEQDTTVFLEADMAVHETAADLRGVLLELLPSCLLTNYCVRWKSTVLVDTVPFSHVGLQQQDKLFLLPLPYDAAALLEHLQRFQLVALGCSSSSAALDGSAATSGAVTAAGEEEEKEATTNAETANLTTAAAEEEAAAAEPTAEEAVAEEAVAEEAAAEAAAEAVVAVGMSSVARAEDEEETPKWKVAAAEPLLLMRQLPDPADPAGPYGLFLKPLILQQLRQADVAEQQKQKLQHQEEFEPLREELHKLRQQQQEMLLALDDEAVSSGCCCADGREAAASNVRDNEAKRSGSSSAAATTQAAGASLVVGKGTVAAGTPMKKQQTKKLKQKTQEQQQQQKGLQAGQQQQSPDHQQIRTKLKDAHSHRERRATQEKQTQGEKQEHKKVESEDLRRVAATEGKDAPNRRSSHSAPSGCRRSEQVSNSRRYNNSDRSTCDYTVNSGESGSNSSTTPSNKGGVCVSHDCETEKKEKSICSNSKSSVTCGSNLRSITERSRNAPTGDTKTSLAAPSRTAGTAAAAAAMSASKQVAKPKCTCCSRLETILLNSPSGSAPPPGRPCARRLEWHFFSSSSNGEIARLLLLTLENQLLHISCRAEGFHVFAITSSSSSLHTSPLPWLSASADSIFLPDGETKKTITLTDTAAAAYIFTSLGDLLAAYSEQFIRSMHALAPAEVDADLPYRLMSLLRTRYHFLVSGSCSSCGCFQHTPQKEEHVCSNTSSSISSNQTTYSSGSAKGTCSLPLKCLSEEKNKNDRNCRNEIKKEAAPGDSASITEAAAERCPQPDTYSIKVDPQQQQIDVSDKKQKDNIHCPAQEQRKERSWYSDAVRVRQMPADSLHDVLQKDKAAFKLFFDFQQAALHAVESFRDSLARVARSGRRSSSRSVVANERRGGSWIASSSSSSSSSDTSCCVERNACKGESQILLRRGIEMHIAEAIKWLPAAAAGGAVQQQKQELPLVRCTSMQQQQLCSRDELRAEMRGLELLERLQVFHGGLPAAPQRASRAVDATAAVATAATATAIPAEALGTTAGALAAVAEAVKTGKKGDADAQDAAAATTAASLKETTETTAVGITATLSTVAQSEGQQTHRDTEAYETSHKGSHQSGEEGRVEKQEQQEQHSEKQQQPEPQSEQMQIEQHRQRRSQQEIVDREARGNRQNRWSLSAPYSVLVDYEGIRVACKTPFVAAAGEAAGEAAEGDLTESLGMTSAARGAAGFANRDAAPAASTAGTAEQVSVPATIDAAAQNKTAAAVAEELIEKRLGCLLGLRRHHASDFQTPLPLADAVAWTADMQRQQIRLVQTGKLLPLDCSSRLPQQDDAGSAAGSSTMSMEAVAAAASLTETEIQAQVTAPSAETVKEEQGAAAGTEVAAAGTAAAAAEQRGKKELSAASAAADVEDRQELTLLRPELMAGYIGFRRRRAVVAAVRSRQVTSSMTLSSRVNSSRGNVTLPAGHDTSDGSSTPLLKINSKDAASTTEVVGTLLLDRATEETSAETPVAGEIAVTEPKLSSVFASTGASSFESTARAKDGVIAPERNLPAAAAAAPRSPAGVYTKDNLDVSCCASSALPAAASPLEGKEGTLIYSFDTELRYRLEQEMYRRLPLMLSGALACMRCWCKQDGGLGLFEARGAVLAAASSTTTVAAPSAAVSSTATTTCAKDAAAAAAASSSSRRAAAGSSEDKEVPVRERLLPLVERVLLHCLLMSKAEQRANFYEQKELLQGSKNLSTETQEGAERKGGQRRGALLQAEKKSTRNMPQVQALEQMQQDGRNDLGQQQHQGTQVQQQQQQQQQKQGPQVIGKHRKKQQKERGQQVQQKPQQQKGNEDQLKPSDGGSRLTVEDAAPGEPDALQEAAEERDGEEAAAEGRQQQKVEEELLTFCLSGEEIELLQLFPVEVDVSLLLGLDLSTRSRQMAAELLQRALASPSLAACCCSSATPAVAATCAEDSSLQATDVIAECSREGSTGTATGLTQPLCVIKQQQQSQQQQVQQQPELLEREGLQDQSLRVEDLQQRCPACVEDSCFWEGDRICYTVSEHPPGSAAATTSLPLSPLRTVSATGAAAAGAAAAGYEVDVSAAMADVALSTASGEKRTSRRLNQGHYFTSSSNAGVSESNTGSGNSDDNMFVSSSCTETRHSAASLAGSCMKGAVAVCAEAQEASVYIHRVAIPLLRELLLQHVANNLVLESSSLKRFFHYCGVNLRYIGTVATSLHNEVAAADHGKLHVSSSSSSSAPSSCSSFGPAAGAAADPVQCLAAAPAAENTATKTVKQCTAASSSSTPPGKTQQQARGSHEDVVLRVLQVELAIRCAVHCFNAILAQVNQTQIAAAAVHLLSCLLCPGTAEYPSKTFPVPSCLSRFFPSTSSSRSCRSNPPQARQRKSQQQQEQQQHQQHQQRQQPKIECGAGGTSLASQVEREGEARSSLQDDDRSVVEFPWWNTTARGLWKCIKLRMRTHFNYQVFSSRSSDIRAEWAWLAESTHRYRLLRGVCSAVGIQLNASHDFAAFLTTSFPPFLRILEPWLNLSPPAVARIPAVAVSRAVAADPAVDAVAAAASPSARASAADDLHGDRRASCRGPDTPQKEKISSTAAVALPGPASSIQPSDASTEATGHDTATTSSPERSTQAAGDHSMPVSDVSVAPHRSVSPRICMSSSEGESQRRRSHDSTNNGSTDSSSSSRGIEVSSSCLELKGDTCEVNTRVMSQRQRYGSSLEDKEEDLAAETTTTASAIGQAAAGENAAGTRGNETQQERGLLPRQQQQHERNVNQSIDSNSSESQSTTAEHTAARAVRSRRRSVAHPQQQQDKLQQNPRDSGEPLQLQQQCERHTETPNSSWRPLKLDSFCRCFPVVKTDAVVSPLISGLLATATEACAIGWLDVALEVYQQTLYIIHQITGTVCREAALCYTAMGHVMLALDEYLTACNYFQKALILTERCEGVDHPATIELHAALSRALAELPGEAYLLRSMQHVLRALLLLRLWGGTATAAQEVVVLLLLAAKRIQRRRQLYGTTSSSSNKSSSNGGGAHEIGGRTMSSSSEQDRKTTPNKIDSSSSSISERPRSSAGSKKKKRKNRGLLHEQQKIADEISSSSSLPRQQQDKRHSHMMVSEGLQQRDLCRGNASVQQQQLQQANKRRSSAADVQFFLSKATEILDTIPEHNPASLAELHIDISQCYYVEENFRKALHHCRRAHQLQGSNRQSATPAEELHMKKVEEHLMFLTHQAVMAEKKQRNAATERKDLVRRLRAVMQYKRNGKVLMW